MSKKLLATKQAEQIANALVENDDYEVFVMDDDFTKIKNRDRNRYDALVSLDDLCKVQNAGVISVLEGWKDVLKEDGELHLFVPSLEWAANELLAEEPSPVILSHIYGAQDKPDAFRVSGFTMRRLRRDLDVAGYAVESATVGESIVLASGNAFIVGQLYVKARKKCSGD